MQKRKDDSARKRDRALEHAYPTGDDLLDRVGERQKDPTRGSPDLRKLMNRHVAWGITLGVALTPFLLCAGVLPMGAGHGTYFPAFVLFPYAMLVATVGRFHIGILAILTALLQYPVYGLVIGYYLSKGRVRTLLIASGTIIGLHAVAVLVPMSIAMIARGR